MNAFIHVKAASAVLAFFTVGQAEAYTQFNGLTDVTFIANEDDVKALSSADLIAVYQAVTGKDTKKFASRDKGIKQVLTVLSALAPQEFVVPQTETAPQETEMTAATQAPTQTAVQASPMAETNNARRKRGFVSAKLLPKVYPARSGTKQAILIDMLAYPYGTTAKELAAELSRKGKKVDPSGITGWFYWDVSAVKGYGVRTEFHDKSWMAEHGHSVDADEMADGEERPVYYIVLPEGMTRPLPHTPTKAV